MKSQSSKTLNQWKYTSNLKEFFMFEKCYTFLNHIFNYRLNFKENLSLKVGSAINLPCFININYLLLQL